MSTSWVAEVIADSSEKWTRNALRFATKEEAEGYVADLYCRWTMVSKTRVLESDDPVNHSWDTATGRVRDPLPRATGDLVVTPITDPEQFVQDILEDVKALRKHWSRKP